MNASAVPAGRSSARCPRTIIHWTFVFDVEIGVDLSLTRCCVCDAPFCESAWPNTAFLPDPSVDENYPEIAFLQRNFALDLSRDETLVCRSCVDRVEGMLTHDEAALMATASR